MSHAARLAEAANAAWASVRELRRTGGQGGSRLQRDADAAELACDFEELVRPFQPPPLMMIVVRAG
jgi:hypothetical protein